MTAPTTPLDQLLAHLPEIPAQLGIFHHRVDELRDLRRRASAARKRTDCRRLRLGVDSDDGLVLVLGEPDRAIRRNRQPEPSGKEGLQDVRIVQALYESAETGKAVQIPPFRDAKQPTGRQQIRRPGISKPALVNVQSASR